MDAILPDCDVASATWHSWHGIPWQQVHQVVARLQARIAKAAKAGEWRKVRSLQRLLTQSTSAKALAVLAVNFRRRRASFRRSPNSQSNWLVRGRRGAVFFAIRLLFYRFYSNIARILAH